jgi:two-component system, LuxR family, sensor kinase FixL
MSYVTILWSVVAASALLLAVVHIIVWLLDHRARASLAFTFTSLGIVGMVCAELGMMSARNAQEWGEWLRWYHLGNFALIVGAVLFVRVYLGTGRPWLMWTVITLRTFILAVNFVVPPNFNFQRIDSITKIPFLGEQISVVSEAVTGRLQWVAVLANALLLLYCIDATVTLWRRGPLDPRRRAFFVGAAISAFFACAIFYTQLVIWRAIDLPMLSGPPFVFVLVVMAYEMGRDTLRASRLARDLSDSEQRLELAAHAGGLGLWSWDARNDRIWATDSARAMFSVADSDANRERLMAMVHADDIAAVREALRQAVSSGSEQEAQFRIRAPDGSIRWLRTHGRAERDERGKVALIRGVVRDVTAEHRAKEELGELRRDLAHAGRVTVLGQLTAALAHELSQPLGSILRNAEAAEMLLERPDPDLKELREILTDIHRDDRRATEVIDRLRALLKRRQMEFQPIAVDTLVHDVTSLVRADAMARDLTIEAAIQPELGMVSGDKVHLSQVLINLIVNAMDAAAGLPPERRKVMLRAHRGQDGSIEIAVSDCGAGISSDVMKKMFEPFFTTKATGMGMGLSVSRTIIEAHHGRLTASNNPAGGATFHFSLPACHVAHA